MCFLHRKPFILQDNANTILQLIIWITGNVINMRKGREAVHATTPNCWSIAMYTNAATSPVIANLVDYTSWHVSITSVDMCRLHQLTRVNYISWYVSITSADTCRLHQLTRVDYISWHVSITSVERVVVSITSVDTCRLQQLTHVCLFLLSRNVKLWKSKTKVDTSVG